MERNVKYGAIPRDLEGVTQGWLEAVLNQGKPLPQCKLIPINANSSNAAFLSFSDSPRFADVPQTCILKLCPAGHSFLAASEVNYYTRDYVGLTDAPIPECYHAVWDGGQTAQSLGEGYALFLEDLSADYTDNKLVEPTEEHAAQLGKALGQLHAKHWGRDADPDGPHDLQADLKRYLAHVSKGLAPILDDLEDTLDVSSRERLTKAFDVDADLMLQRALKGHGLTLVHGDPNPTNVLTCDTPKQGCLPLYLIDRQPFDWSLRLWLGASDLVYATVPFWSEQHRRAYQNNLLQCYHQNLLAQGVSGYSIEELHEDWSLCACVAVFTAIEWGADPETLKDMKWLWETQLRRALVFLEDCETVGVLL
ncbi:MAG: phosphotransferase [Pseudomonadota bacterium]